MQHSLKILIEARKGKAKKYESIFSRGNNVHKLIFSSHLHTYTTATTWGADANAGLLAQLGTAAALQFFK